MKRRAKVEKSPPKGEELGAFCKWDGDVLILNVLGSPASAMDAIGHVDGLQLRVSVTARPRLGNATDHMLAFLAPHFGVKAEDIVVVFGRKNVNKQLRIPSPCKLPPVIAEFLARPD